MTSASTAVPRTGAAVPGLPGVPGLPVELVELDPLPRARNHADLGMRPDEALDLVENLLDVYGVGPDRGETEDGSLAEIQVIEFSCGDAVTSPGRVEQVTDHLPFVLQACSQRHPNLDGQQRCWHFAMIARRSRPT